MARELFPKFFAVLVKAPGVAGGGADESVVVHFPMMIMVCASCEVFQHKIFPSLFCNFLRTFLCPFYQIASKRC